MITLTDNFIARLKRLQEKDGKPDLALRIAVEGGGCQGYEYRLTLVSQLEDRQPDDHVFDRDGAAVLVDEISLPFLKGAAIDYTDELIGAGFKIDNPNAQSACGCGTSFTPKDES